MINVLVIDDSAVVRQTITALLHAQGDIAVTVAPDPLIGISKMQQNRPDVIILDLEMPRMDGLTFLRKVMAEDPIPVIVCSGRVEKGSADAFRALEEGAVDLIAKPQIGIKGFLYESAVLLVDTVRAAAAAQPRKRTHAGSTVRPSAAGSAGTKSSRLIAIGASTGGTEAIRSILTALPANTCGIVIVQHMPEVFTHMYAKHLDAVCGMKVKEAQAGDVVQDGTALIAPGNRHLAVRSRAGKLSVELLDEPLVSRHRPSVDVLFESVARSAGPSAIGVLLTGMGRDGAAGLLEMSRAGAWTIAQDEASSVVFGMPREAIALGAAQQVLALDAIPDALLARSYRITPPTSSAIITAPSA